VKSESLFRKWYKTVIWFLLILTGSLLPGKSMDGLGLIPIPYFDKFVHFAWYAVLFMLIHAADLKTGRNSGWFVFRTLLFCMITGVVMELLQIFVTSDRSGDIADLIANYAGAMSGWFLYRFSIRFSLAKRFLS
jgi:VanZ family protein